MGKGRGANLVEGRFAMLLEGLAQHLGGQPGLHILQALDGVVPVLQLYLVALLQGLLGEGLLERQAIKLSPQLVPLLGDSGHRLRHRELLGQGLFIQGLSGFVPLPEGVAQRVLYGQILRQLRRIELGLKLAFGQGHGVPLLPLGHGQAFLEGCGELVVPHLL